MIPGKIYSVQARIVGRGGWSCKREFFRKKSAQAYRKELIAGTDEFIYPFKEKNTRIIVYKRTSEVVK